MTRPISEHDGKSDIGSQRTDIGSPWPHPGITETPPCRHHDARSEYMARIQSAINRFYKAHEQPDAVHRMRQARLSGHGPCDDTNGKSERLNAILERPGRIKESFKGGEDERRLAQRQKRLRDQKTISHTHFSPRPARSP
jgi:hypothetical protein